MRLWKPVLALLLVAALFAVCASSAPSRDVSPMHALGGGITTAVPRVAAGVTSALEARTPPVFVHRAKRVATRSANHGEASAGVSARVQTQPPTPPPHGDGYHGSVPDLIRSIWGSAAGCALRIAYRESRFNPRAYNSSGAAGLFQLMPIWYRGRWHFDPFSAYLNTLYAHRMYLDYGFGPWGGCP